MSEKENLFKHVNELIDHVNDMIKDIDSGDHWSSHADLSDLTISELKHEYRGQLFALNFILDHYDLLVESDVEDR